MKSLLSAGGPRASQALARAWKATRRQWLDASERVRQDISYGDDDSSLSDTPADVGRPVVLRPGAEPGGERSSGRSPIPHRSFWTKPPADDYLNGRSDSIIDSSDEYAPKDDERVSESPFGSGDEVLTPGLEQMVVPRSASTIEEMSDEEAEPEAEIAKAVDRDELQFRNTEDSQTDDNEQAAESRWLVDTEDEPQQVAVGADQPDDRFGRDSDQDETEVVEEETQYEPDDSAGQQIDTWHSTDFEPESGSTLAGKPEEEAWPVSESREEIEPELQAYEDLDQTSDPHEEAEPVSESHGEVVSEAYEDAELESVSIEQSDLESESHEELEPCEDAEGEPESHEALEPELQSHEELDHTPASYEDAEPEHESHEELEPRSEIDRHSAQDRHPQAVADLEVEGESEPTAPSAPENASRPALDDESTYQLSTDPALDDATDSIAEAVEESWVSPRAEVEPAAGGSADSGAMAPADKESDFAAGSGNKRDLEATSEDPLGTDQAETPPDDADDDVGDGSGPYVVASAGDDSFQLPDPAADVLVVESLTSRTKPSETSSNSNLQVEHRRDVSPPALDSENLLSSSSHGAARGLLSGTQVLVAEVDDMIRAIIRHRLERQGSYVVEAADGMEAVGVFQSQRFDLVIISVSLPGLDGFEVLSWIRGESANTDVPVVMLEWPGDPSIMSRAFDTGADDFLRKPFSPVEMVARATRLLVKRSDRKTERGAA